MASKGRRRRLTDPTSTGSSSHLSRQLRLERLEDRRLLSNSPEMLETITSGFGIEPRDFIAFSGALYFSAQTHDAGRELWRSDGTAAGTSLLKDLLPGYQSSNPSNFTIVGDRLYFTATDDAGEELWASDGTDLGTYRIKDVNVGYDYNPWWEATPRSSRPRFLTAIGETLYFNATDEASGSELWKSDGTDAGTVRVKDIGPAEASSSPASLTNIGGTLYFGAYTSGEGADLWKSDGTAEGTVLVKDVSSARGAFSGDNAISQVGDLFYFISGPAAWCLPWETTTEAMRFGAATERQTGRSSC